MSTNPLKLWSDTQPTLLINSVKLMKNHQSARKKAKTVSQKHHECYFYLLKTGCQMSNTSCSSEDWNRNIH